MSESKLSDTAIAIKGKLENTSSAGNKTTTYDIIYVHQGLSLCECPAEYSLYSIEHWGLTLCIAIGTIIAISMYTTVVVIPTITIIIGKFFFLSLTNSAILGNWSW